MTHRSKITIKDQDKRTPEVLAWVKHIEDLVDLELGRIEQESAVYGTTIVRVLTDPPCEQS